MENIDKPVQGQYVDGFLRSGSIQDHFHGKFGARSNGQGPLSITSSKIIRFSQRKTQILSIL